MWDMDSCNCMLANKSEDEYGLQKGNSQACTRGDPETHKILVGGHGALSKQRHS